ncbi:MBL fold metallo-hydrolase, partial [Sutterella wadsworthensis]|uniref:MBL fold metallo-hydrolase n=1 Tax=Sutterella wadsworthensis TaxID=40545 RepID=UPI003967909B
MSAAHNSVRRRLLLGGAAVAGLAAAGAAAGSAVMARADFGALPTGERLKRIQASPHWQDGSFHNLVPMELSASGRSRLEIMRDFLLDRNPQRFPSAPVPHIKTHFAAVPDNHMVWLGHSGFFIHWAGLKVLIDPALHQAFPVPGFYKPFPGTDCWEPADLPAADLLLITHDHYDHLDYRTGLDLKNRVRRVVCPLGVGAHFEAWGWEAERITELDWQESVRVGGLTVSAV